APTNQGLGLFLWFDSVDVQNMQCVGPGNDPDSALIVNDYFRTICAGVKVVRFILATEAISSNVATYAQCRQRADLSCGFQHTGSAQIAAMDVISPCTMVWNGNSYAIADKSTLFPAAQFASAYHAMKCTTAAPHGLYTGQKIDM